MEVKEWNNYTKEEKRALLNHWWYYYGKEIYTFDELEAFNKMIDQRDDEILELAVLSYTRNLSNQVLLYAMRLGQTKELFSSLPDTDTDNEQFNIAYKAICADFLGLIVKSYNEPEPDVPMSEEDIINQLGQL